MHRLLIWPDIRQILKPDAGAGTGFLTQHLNVIKNTKKQQQRNQCQFHFLNFYHIPGSNLLPLME
jgi:hypothetical protein